MPVRRDPKSGAWFFRTTVIVPDGKKLRIYGTPGVPGPYHDLAQSERGAIAAEQRAIKEALTPKLVPIEKQEVPTFKEWFRGTATGEEAFNGRFWLEWVIGRKNKPTEVRSKVIIFENHLEPWFGDMPLDKITTSEVARFRAHLVALGTLGEKRINNILAVLSKPLKYAVDCEVLAKAPKIGMYKVERPEIVAWDFEQYARLITAAKVEGDEWLAAVCLCGEAGLRVGEMKALRWREDVDLIAKTITVNQQTRNGETTTPKGRTRRTVPMTSTLYDALKAMSVIREGFVIRNFDGSAKTDDQADVAIRRIYRRAGLPDRYWHILRHTFGTHAALFGVNPWRLQTWLGHKRIDETMLYVHVAEAHARELPEHVRIAGELIGDLDKRIIAMLGARAARGSHVAAEPRVETKNAAISAA